MFTFAISCNLESISLDFTQAFPQADLKKDVYMEIPFGFGNGDNQHVLKLKSNFYGLSDASLTWFEHCKKGLLERGFVASKIDPCLFFKKGLILILYVDDACIFGISKELIYEFVQSLKRPDPKDRNKYPYSDGGFDFTTEDSIEKFLGVEVSKHGNTITLRQPLLIDRIIEAVGFDNTPVYSKPTPSTGNLCKDEDGQERKDLWSYRSVIGMLNYLASTTRPDIMMAVHQCARFTESPKLSHEKAVKRIIKYLIGTKHIRIRAEIDKSKGLVAYADADFASTWNKMDPENYESVFSRTGYVIYFYRIPVTWHSKLQSRIALSSTEAEYHALSTCLRDVIPIMNLINEISNHISVNTTKPNVKCRLFEDNESCVKIAKAPI